MFIAMKVAEKIHFFRRLCVKRHFIGTDAPFRVPTARKSSTAAGWEKSVPPICSLPSSRRSDPPYYYPLSSGSSASLGAYQFSYRSAAKNALSTFLIRCRRMVRVVESIV
jgi:hypothetical protein